MGAPYNNIALDLTRQGLPLVAGLGSFLYTQREYSKDYPMNYRQNTYPKKRKGQPLPKTLVVTKKPRLSRQNAFAGTPRSTKDKKWVDTAGTLTFSNTIQQVLLNGTVLGSDYYERLGHNFSMKKLHMQMTLYPAPLTTTPHQVQLVLLYDRQANGAAPAWADFSQSTSENGTTTAGWNTQFNIEQSDRFLILWKKMLTLPGYTNTAGVLTDITDFGAKDLDLNIEIHKTLPNLPVRCSGDTSAIGSILSGSLYFSTLSSNSTAGWNCIYNARIRFEG